MIRINLSRSDKFMNAGESGGQDIFNKDLDFKIEWSHFKKLLIVLIFPSALFSYQRFNSFILTESLNKSLENVRKAEEDLKKYGDISSVIQELVEEKNKMNEKIKIIRLLSKRRILKTDVLLKIQEKIPQNMWLKKVFFEKERIVIDGYSKEISLIQEMAERLKTIEFIELVDNKNIQITNKKKYHKFGFELKFKD